MEEDMLTAVTKQSCPTIAPLPSVQNRLSVVDFQRLVSEKDNSQVPGNQTLGIDEIIRFNL